jgi:hypothetical protein
MVKTALSVSSAAAVCLSMGPVTILAAPDAAGATRAPLRQLDRRCDFSPIYPVPAFGYGVGIAMIGRGGPGVVADVTMSYATPDTHYDVVLIQMPRPSSATCGPGDPGTAVGSLNTDGAGSGAVTVQDSIRPGTTGAWVTVQRPAEHSQTPAEYYTSDIIAPV